MGSEEELLKIGRRLEKRVSGRSTERVLDLLKELQRFQITVDLLRSTRIGVTVNKLKKRSEEREIGELAKSIIKDWKRLLDASYKEKSTTASTVLGSPPRADIGRFPTKKKLHSEKPREMLLTSYPNFTCSPCPDNFLQPDSQQLVIKDPKLKRNHSIDVQSTHTPKRQESLSLNSPVLASSALCCWKFSSSSKEERRQSLGSSTPATPCTPSKPIAGTNEERRHSFNSPTHGNTSSKSATDTKEERRHSLGSPTHVARNTVNKPTTDHKEERRHSLGSPTSASRNGSTKPVSDNKEERRHSLGSPISTNRNGSSKAATDSKVERRHSLGSPIPAARNGSSKPATDSKEERKHSLGSPTHTAHNTSSKQATDMKEERRHSHGSPTPASRNGSSKLGADTRVESTSGELSSPQADSSTSPSSFLSSCYLTGDSVRDKCVVMVTSALKTDDDYKQFGANCERLAFEIEESIYREMKTTDMKYRNRVRSRISNLKDPKNPNLRRNVLCGIVTPQSIAIMTAEEMASDELRELRNTLTQEAIREHQMAKTGGTNTDLLQCDKCKKKNCSYNQVQTRSADEPMTTFVLCNECGYRWKERESLFRSKELLQSLQLLKRICPCLQFC
ncbi:LOW QUALITY PROTEIN: uncharacterized protein RCH25_044275 [Pelodytes ibericus]